MKHYFRNMSFTPAVRRDLAVVASGRAASLVGDEIALVTLLLWASARGHGPLVVASLVMAAALPQLLAAPVAGLLADRLSARRLVATVSALQAVVCAGLVAAVASDVTWLVVAAVLALNLGQAVVAPAWQALVPAMVGEEGLGRALALLQTTTAGAGLVGPVLGGLLVGAVGTTGALTVDAVSFLALAGAALMLRADRRPEPGAAPGRGELWAGLRLVSGEPLLRSVVVLLVAVVLVLGAVNVAEVFLVTQVLGAGPTAYGVCGALFAVGLMLGAWLARRDMEVTTSARLLVLAMAGMAVAIAALGLAPGIVVAAAAGFGVGIGNGALNVLAQTIVVRIAPQAVLGRVFAVLQGAAGAGMLVSTAVGGLLLGLLSPRAVVTGSGLATVVVALLVGSPLLRGARRPADGPTPQETPSLLPG
ncbi:MAG: MFS transporter [Frankiales bacterium]|nr:MFS transporter [Frankiales bacterium]